MKQLLLTSALALTVSGCVTVNGKSLLSMLPGSTSASAPGPSSSSSSEPAAAGAPATPGAVVALESAPVTVTLSREAVQLTRPLSEVGQCQVGSMVSAQPTVQFSVAKETKLKITARSPFVLQRPDRRSYCLDFNEKLETQFAPGTYAVFAKGSGGMAAATQLEVLQVERALEAAKAALAGPPLVLDGAAPKNPLVAAALKTGPVVEAKTLVKCGNVYEVQPVTRLEVKTRAKWTLATNGRLVVQRPDGACDEGGGDWAPGEYSVFLVVNDPKQARDAVTLTVSNTERRLELGDVAARTPGELPMAFEVPVQQAEAYAAVCGVPSLTPSAVFELKKPLNAAFRLVNSHGGAQFTVLPLNEVPLNKLCAAAGELRDTLPAGRYALFATSKEAKTALVALEPRAKNEYSWPDAWKVSLKTWRDVPASVPLEQREVSAWYPWYELRVVEPLFLAAPKSLFVTVNADASPVSPGEPLLLVKHGPEFSTVARVTGEQTQVRTERLADLSGPVKLPALPEPSPIENRLEAWAARAPASLEPRVQAWVSQQHTHSTCFDQYMRAHDPSWGKQNYIIIVSQRKAHEAAADKKCNTAGLDAAWAKLKADITAERASLRAKLSSLPNRLK